MTSFFFIDFGELWRTERIEAVCFASKVEAIDLEFYWDNKSILTRFMTFLYFSDSYGMLLFWSFFWHRPSLWPTWGVPTTQVKFPRMKMCTSPSPTVPVWRRIRDCLSLATLSRHWIYWCYPWSETSECLCNLPHCTGDTCLVILVSTFLRVKTTNITQGLELCTSLHFWFGKDWICLQEASPLWLVLFLYLECEIFPFNRIECWFVCSLC